MNVFPIEPISNSVSGVTGLRDASSAKPYVPTESVASRSVTPSVSPGCCVRSSSEVMSASESTAPIVCGAQVPGVTVADGADSGPLPLAFVAYTVNV